MFQKTWKVTLSLTLLAGIIVLLTTVRIEKAKEVSIAVPIYNVIGQFTDLRNWLHWHPLLHKADSSSIQYTAGSSHSKAALHYGKTEFELVSSGPVSIVVTETDQGKTILQSLSAVADSMGRYTKVQWKKSIGLVSWARDKVAGHDDMEMGLNNLKHFVEDPARLYGFPLEIRQVVDTLVITKRAQTTIDQRNQMLQKLYDELLTYARTNGLHSNGIRLGAFRGGANDEMEIMAGIPVDKKVLEANGIYYLHMPRNGRMLVGSYEGPYDKVALLYNAMDRYTIDKSLQKVAQGYEKYFTDPKSSSDSMHMKIEIYYPIF